jgi:hypothetical protein
MRKFRGFIDIDQLPNGLQGVEGPQGPQGPQGSQSATGTSGANAFVPTLCRNLNFVGSTPSYCR